MTMATATTHPDLLTGHAVKVCEGAGRYRSGRLLVAQGQIRVFGPLQVRVGGNLQVAMDWDPSRPIVRKSAMVQATVTAIDQRSGSALVAVRFAHRLVQNASAA